MLRLPNVPTPCDTTAVSRPRTVTVLATLLACGLTDLIIITPSLHFAYRSVPLHAMLETAAALIGEGPRLGLVVFMAMTGNLMVAGFAGAFIPILLPLAIPALVVHGRRDPFFPVGNGEALAREIPGARLLVLEQASTAIPDAATD